MTMIVALKQSRRGTMSNETPDVSFVLAASSKLTQWYRKYTGRQEGLQRRPHGPHALRH